MWQAEPMRIALAALVAATAVPGAAAEPYDPVDVGQAVVNPFSNQIVVPLTLNWDKGGGPGGDGNSFVFEIEPLVPIRLSENWALISRTTLPFVVQSHIADGPPTDETGIGDIMQSLLLSPRHEIGGWLSAGVGPAFLIPTASSKPIGNDRFSVGPAVQLNIQTSTLTFDLLAYQIWSVKGDGARDPVNRAYVEPSITFTGKGGINYGINAEAGCDWLAPGRRCSVPINVTIAHPVHLSPGVDMVLTGGGRYHAVRAENDPTWGLRLEAAFVFAQRH